MISKILSLTLFVMMTAATFAQNVTVKGTVTEQDTGLPLPGVNIVLKSTARGVTSDFDGVFTMEEVPVNATLVFSYLGYVTKEVKVLDASALTVTLSQDTEALEEIVIIGYGTQKATNVSGAISTVNQKSIEKLKPVRAEDALQGQAAGVNIVSNGSPGAAPAITIRGVVSNGGNDPLVVIDGIQQSIADLNALNPMDIASINVLKDAATAAIYGVRGGNGVIIVTTKSGGKNSKTRFSFDASYGVQEVVKTIDVLNASEYAAILNEASVAAGQGIVFDDISAFGTGTNWQNEVLEQAPMENYNISASGGSDKSSYYFSGGFLGQDGVVSGGDKSYFDRLTLTSKFDTDLTSNLKFLTQTSYTNIKGKSLPENSITSVLSNALNFDPTVSPYDDNGNYGISETITQEIVNPLAQISNIYNKNNTNKLFGKLELQYEPIKNLKLTSRLGYTYVDIYNKTFTPLVYYGTGHNGTTANPDLTPIVSIDPETNEEVSTHNRVSESKTNYFTYTLELFANYDFNIKEDHHFQTVVGFSKQRDKGENITANAEDVPFNSWAYADVGAATGDLASQTSSSWQSIKRNLSYFGRINYDYKDKYLLSFTGRVDGSTVFGKNNKFGFFPSASVGWIVSNEDFFSSSLVDFLKVRASYGNVGSDGIPNQFSAISTFPKYTFDGAIITGSTLGTVPNDDVSWESQIQINAGFDARFFSNSLSVTADYYKKTTEDLLFAPPLPGLAGTVAAPPGNIGTSSTQGVDISLGYNKALSDNLSFSTSFNFTTVSTNVDEVNNDSETEQGSGYGIPFTFINRFQKGYSPWYFFGYQTDGIFQTQSEIDAHATQTGAQPGDIRFVDINGDGVINDSDRTKIGDPFPDFTVGWNLSVNYKNFDFSVFTYASVGNDIYRAYERNSTFTNRFASVLDRWTGPGTSNSEPRVTFVDTNNNIRASDRYVEDGSFVRIKNLQLGYTLPESFNKKSGFSSIRIYGQVRNLLTLTEYSGYDPEITAGDMRDTGIDRGSYPLPRIWSLGINVNF